MSQPTVDHRITVLIVDDVPSDARLVVRLLERATEPTISARHAASYDEGIARLGEGGFDVCLVDYDLGERDGVAFIAEASERAPDVPLVLLTGHDPGLVDRRALRAGAVDFLSKSTLDAASAQRAVRYAVERSRRHRVEARYRALIEHANDIVALVDAAGRVTYLGPSVRRMLGVEPGPRVGRAVRDLAHPEDRAALEQAFATVVAQPARIVPLTFRVRQADAGWRYLDALVANRLDEPAVRAMVLTAWDVTERVEQQAKIAFQARLLDSVGQAVIATDLEGKVRYWNAAAERLYGWSVAEAMGRSIVDLTTPEPAVEQAEEIMGRLAAGETWSGEFCVRDRAGREFLALVANAPFFDADGRLAGIIGASSDVTPFRETERALRERVKELGALFACSRVLQAHDRSLDARLDEVVTLLPAGFQWPSRTALRLSLDDGRTFASPDFAPSAWLLSVPLEGTHASSSRLEAVLCDAPLGEPAFLEEERHLLRSVGGLIAEAVERGRLRNVHARTVASLNEAVLVIGGAGRPHHVTAANPAVESIFGYAPAELLGTSPEHLHPSAEAFRAFRAASHATLRSGGVFEAAAPLRRRDGCVFAAEQRLTLVDPSRGIDGGVIVVIRDVSQRVRVEAELRASEARFRQIAEHLDVCFWITSPDKTRMEYVSPAYEIIWGRSADALYTSPRSWLDAILPADRARVDEAVAAQSQGDYALEYRIARPDGQIRWIRDRAFPVRAAGGEVVRIIGIAEDVTDQRDVETRLRLVTGAISDVISVLDADGTIRYSSPSVERLLGFTAAELEGRSIVERVHPEDVAGVEARLAALSAEPGAVTRVAARVVTREGQPRHVEAVATNRLDEPTLAGIVMTTRDVTERVRLEESHAAGQRLEAIGQLAGAVAHDFNNLLTVIRAQTDLVLMDLPTDSPLGADIRLVQEAADRAARLTAQLLAFSRDQVLQPQRLDLRTVVEATGRLVERVIGERIEVVYRLAPRSVVVEVDPGQLEQVVVNLAVNARDAMPEGGRLTFDVGVERGGGGRRSAVLRVSDTGVGMDEATRQRIFEPFYTTKPKGRGTGLGLATVYGVVVQSGGTIEVESAPGRGTTFVLRFGIAEGPVDGTPPPTPMEVDALASGRVLLVEDDDAVARVAARVLDRAGFTVTRVRSAEAGIALLGEDDDFDVMVTDLVLPKASGVTLTHQVRARWPALAVVWMSGYADEEAGVGRPIPTDVPFVRKPFRPAELVLAVRRALGASEHT